MIKSFKHKGLEKPYNFDDASGINPTYKEKIYKILTILDSAANVDEIDTLPGYKLHPLKGELSGFWSIKVTGNYRIIFRFFDKNIYDVDLLDYH